MSDEVEAPVRRHIAREHYLQVAVARFCEVALNVQPKDFLFMSMNAPYNATMNQRARAVAAGEIQGRPDTVLFVYNLPPIWAELKFGSNKPSRSQQEVLDRLAAIGHHATVVRSVEEYATTLSARGVPLRPHYKTIAADLDLKVAARIARAEARQGTTPKRAIAKKAT